MVRNMAALVRMSFGDILQRLLRLVEQRKRFLGEDNFDCQLTSVFAFRMCASRVRMTLVTRVDTIIHDPRSPRRSNFFWIGCD
jgi:hypothetical protein